MPLENFGSMILNIMNWLFYSILGIGFCVIGWFIWKKGILFGYPVSVIIFEKRHDNLILKKDKACRLMKKNGEIYYKFKNFKALEEKLKPPDYENIILDDKGKSHLLIYSPSPGEYYSVLPTFSDNNAKLSVIDSDLRFWKSVEDKEAIWRWRSKSLLEKFWPIITIAIIAVAFIIVMYGTFEFGIKPVTESAGTVAGKLGEVADKLSLLASNTTGGQPIPLK